MCRGHSHYPAFAPSSSKVAAKFFFVFCILLSIICPNCACTQLFSVPYSFFAFCCPRRCLSRCKHCSAAAEGSRSRPVSAASLTFLDSTLDLVISPALVLLKGVWHTGIKIWVPYLFIVSGVSLPLGPFSRCN